MTPETARALPDGRDCMWAMVAHLAFILGPFALAVSLGLRHTVGHDSEFVADQATEAANFQLTMALAVVACLVLLLVLVGLLLLVVVMIMGVGLSVVAGINAYDGRRYRYPVSMRILR